MSEAAKFPTAPLEGSTRHDPVRRSLRNELGASTLGRSLDLSSLAQTRIIEAARSKTPVTGFTHNFYRYPARFSPDIARAVIEELTDPGDLVVDSFVGGGTSAVEALALGRDALGTDISTLAAFVARAKTTLIDEGRLASITSWVESTVGAINMRDGAPNFQEWSEAGYLKHLDHRDRWRIRKALAQSIGRVPTDDPELERLARCIVLRTAQWALDGRKTIPTLAEFKTALVSNSKAAVDGLRALADVAGTSPSSVCIVNRSAVGLESDPQVVAFFAGRKPRLIITSPPYPGVHVLYHRWQVDGRKETRAPFWIANTLDGAGASYYTMGDRKRPDQAVYFDTLRGAQKSLAAIADANTVIVQIVAFSQPETQLARYNEAACAAGLEEVLLPTLSETPDGRLWREVPNRKWYTGQRSATSASNEVVLFYHLAR